MFCSECGADNKASAKFCEDCGGKLGSPDVKPTQILGGAEKIVGLQDITTDAVADLGHVGRRFATAFSPGRLTDIGLSLLPQEKVLQELSIGFLDRGILFWRRNRLILTNQRIISYSRKIIDENVVAAHLRDITSITNGSRSRGLQALFGALILLFGIYSLISGLPNGDVLQGLFAIVIGAAIVLFLGKRVFGWCLIIKHLASR